jgi:hypothetical protein
MIYTHTTRRNSAFTKAMITSAFLKAKLCALSGFFQDNICQTRLSIKANTSERLWMASERRARLPDIIPPTNSATTIRYSIELIV